MTTTPPDPLHGRTTLSVREVAFFIGMTPRHVLNLVDSGDLKATNFACSRNKSDRRFLRVSVSEFKILLEKRSTL